MSKFEVLNAQEPRLGDSIGSEVESYPRVILRGDYPDPSILREGSDYYMTHSPFLYTPGFLIWHSQDLMNWQPIARAMTDVVGSAMAPDLIKYEGKYYIYFPAAGVNWVITADNICGPWTQPVRLEVGYIDPGHAVGEDGKRYLFLSEGYRVLLSNDGLSVQSELEKVYEGWEYPNEWITEGVFLESPKIFRRGDYFYKVSAEGGTAGPPTSHMAIAARSKSIHGPWENSPYNPIVHTYSADEHWWSKGHGTIVNDVNGHWWIVYHAYENGFYTLGRHTLIEPIEWLADDWFRAATTATSTIPLDENVTHGIALSDDFSGRELGLQWMTWQEYDPQNIKLVDNSLHLKAKGTDPTDARLLLVTAPDYSYEIQVKVTLDENSNAGLVLFYYEKAFAGIAFDGRQFSIYKSATETIQLTSESRTQFSLKIINRENFCELQMSTDDETWTAIEAGLDVSQLHHNNFDRFLALRPGLIAMGEGIVKFEDFQYRTL